MIANVPRSDVGNHSFEFSIPTRFRDGNSHTIYAYGQDLTSGKPDVLLIGSPKTFNIAPSITKVVFDPITDEVIEQQFTHSEIDRATGFEGQRIFPDAKQPDENVNRKRVRVKATIAPAVKDVRVYFKNFDVDDPSSDISIDDNDVNGSTGNDNREGRVIDQPYPANAAGTLSAASALTDINGVATVYFTVTKQPGDNFVVSASSDEIYSNGIVVNGTDLKDSTNKSLPTAKAQRTELLTVWRKLHMEVDSMGEVQGNFITGFLRTKGEYIDSNSKTIEFQPSKRVLEGVLETGAYGQTLADNGTRLSYGGRMIVAGVNIFQTLRNSPIELDNQTGGDRTPGGERIEVQNLNGTVYLRPNHPFKLFDDDDFNSDDGDQKDGDNGENVELLNDTLSHMQAKDNIGENAYAAAYIMPEYQWAEAKGFNNSNIPFELYSPCTLPDCDEQRKKINAQRGSQASERDDFWVGYLLVSYQANESDDADPSGFLGGIAPKITNTARDYEDYYNQSSGVPPGGIGAVIFIEAIRDYALKPFALGLGQPPVTFARTRIATHEVGHQFGLGHNNHRENGGIMSYTGDLYFAPNHINMVRWRVKSPGEGQ